jgi:hypothetical protein
MSNTNNESDVDNNRIYCGQGGTKNEFVAFQRTSNVTHRAGCHFFPLKLVQELLTTMYRRNEVATLISVISSVSLAIIHFLESLHAT